MWKSTSFVALTLVLAAGVVGGAYAPTGESPLADAGLDQSVTRGATVLLDGTGSFDPDGEIDTYHWSVLTPEGETITPSCPSCARTEFEPTDTGTYEVTLTVTDDDGKETSDTLYVTVAPGAKPRISISGPRSPTVGESAVYSATVRPGAASLDRIVWTVGGTEVDGHSLSFNRSTDTLTHLFPTPGERTITATVYDEDGQRRSDSLRVSVRAEPASSDSPQRGTEPEKMAVRYQPTVTGNRVVTGRKPLRGEYAVTLDAPRRRVKSIEWRGTADEIRGKREVTATWTPGDHDIYALVTYADGSRNVATFDDGSTTVVADSAPNVSFDSLERYGAISASASADDSYENLRSLRVEVDGEVVKRSRGSSPRRHLPDRGRRRTIHLTSTDFEPGEEHRVTVVAIDERGQTARATRTIVPVKKPKIIESKFVNGPVDSYHPRIAPSRYAAHHVLKIDLNGVDRENITVELNDEDKNLKLKGGEYKEISYNDRNDILTVNSFWYGDYPKEYRIYVGYRMESGEKGLEAEETNRFEVTPSPPELRLDVISDGTAEYITRRHGIVVDAGRSFDPDGTDLEYIWQYGAEPKKADNTTAKFWSYQRAGIVLKDGYGLKTSRSVDFLEYYLPDVSKTEVLTEGPYYPNESVRVRIATETYDFSKVTYRRDYELGLSVSARSSDIVAWRQVTVTDPAYSNVTETPRRYVGTVEIPASEFTSSSSPPTITVFNAQNRHKKVKVDVPPVEVLVDDGRQWSNLTVEELSYLVERPRTDQVVTESETERDEYLMEGYSIASAEQKLKWILEERVKIRDAKYETLKRSFSTEQARNLFVHSMSGWHSSGFSRDSKTVTRTRSDWRDSKGRSEWHDSNPWNGEYTGRSRRVLKESAEYRTEHQYRYNYEVEKTGTRTVTHSYRIRIPVTKTRTVRHCAIGLGCYTTTETYTRWETRRRTYTTTETYTYTVTRTETYWALGKRGWRHDATGWTRRIQTQPAEYDIEYKIERKVNETEMVTRYNAEREKLVRPATYEWKRERTTNTLSRMLHLAHQHDTLRAGGSINTTTWTLVKTNGTTQLVTPRYRENDQVLETRAVVSGDVIQRYYALSSGEIVLKPLGQRTERVTYNGRKTKSSIIRDLTRSRQHEECRMEVACL